jgi:hypothetical protein
MGAAAEEVDRAEDGTISGCELCQPQGERELTLNGEEEIFGLNLDGFWFEK